MLDKELLYAALEILSDEFYIIQKDKSFPNPIKSTRNQIVYTIFRLIWIQVDVRLDPNQSENGKYNLISGSFNKILRKKNSLR